MNNVQDRIDSKRKYANDTGKLVLIARAMGHPVIFTEDDKLIDSFSWRNMRGRITQVEQAVNGVVINYFDGRIWL